MTPRLSIVVPALNEAARIGACLRALAGQRERGVARGVPHQPVGRQPGCLPHHVDTPATADRRGRVLVRQLRVLVQQPPHHHQVASDALGILLAQRAQPRTDLT